MPGPTTQSLPIIRRRTGHIVLLSISITSGTSGAIWSTRLSAVKLKLMTRTGVSPRCQPKSRKVSTRRFSTSPP